MKPRLTKFRLILLAAFLLGIVAWYYSFHVEPYWIEVTHYQINAPLTAPIKIAHITDLHTNGVGKREQKMIELVDAESPDLIVITGDSVDTNGHYESLQDVLLRLHAPLGVLVVRGNHENWHPLNDENAFYEGSGVIFLVNSSKPVRNDVWVIGLDDEFSGRPNIEAAIKGVPHEAYKIALFHSPSYYDRAASHCNLALAGHSHGGQVRLPFIGPLWLPPNCNGYVSGWYDRDGSRLYVSRGIGTSIFGARFLCRPELAIITVGP